MTIRRLRWLIPLLLLAALSYSPSASAQSGFAWRGWCELGNVNTVTSGLTSATVGQGSFPQCSVAVFNHGAGLATIYSDAGLTTPLANPFIATTSGFWTFYAAAGHYDVQNASSVDVTMPMPITYSDVLLGGAGSGGGVTTLNSLTGAVTIAQGSGINVSTVGSTITITNTGGSGGSGCTPTGGDTAVQTNHPIGTCFGSQDFTWNDTSSVLQAGGTPNSLAGSHLFVLGDANTQTGSGISEDYIYGLVNTLADCNDCYIFGEDNSTTIVSGTSGEQYTFGNFNTLSLAGTNNYVFGQENNLTGTSGGLVEENVVIGQSNTITVNSSGKIGRSFMFGELNTFTTGTSGNDHGPTYIIGEQNSVSSTGAIAGPGNLTIVGENNSASTSGSQDISYATIIGVYNTLTGDAGMFGAMFGNALTLTSCTSCYLYGENGSLSTNSIVGIGLSATPELEITPGAASFTFLTPSECVVTDGSNQLASASCSAAGLADPGGNGLVIRTALNTTTARTLTGTTNYVTVTNGTGVGGNPTINVGANVADLSIADTWVGLQTFSAGAKVAANQPFIFVEGTAPSAVSGQTVLYSNSTALFASIDGGGFAQIPRATVTVPLGGTGGTTFTAHGVIIGEGAGGLAATATGTAAQCLTSNGAGSDPTFQNCGGAASTALSGITAATSASTIGSGDNNIRFNWDLTTASGSAFYIGESGASTATTAYLLRASTVSTSTLNVVRFDNNGNGLVMSNVGVLNALGTGSVAWTALSGFPTACTNQFATGLTTTSLTCASVSLTAAVTGILPIANGGTASSSPPVKRLLLRFAGCNAGSFAPSFDIPTSGGMGSNCKTDGSNGTVQGIMSANKTQSAFSTVIIPGTASHADWTSFGDATIWFTTSDTTAGDTIIFNVSTACTAPNGGNVDTPSYNTPDFFTTVTIGGGATPNALYETATTGALNGTGCARGDVLHLKFTRTSDTSTDTAIALTGDMVIAYNGSY